ncbi:hypothetical protein UFOVP225_94 [uncultured Caudovirales phage]|uniref:Uncharacterized protein n=1 Tax=uncultured Caudovirales phage TaxID=2100421 RepID=A0A6J5L264_9CAUD|nr:hypothetical protein UFOVP113_107 [uncultured Caudovirales phage]CAB5219603.1 hypothetical protein UFOVP225_94 [uncultured Caudovirales phage]
MAKKDPAREAAERDMVGVYGRGHGASVIKGSYTDPKDHPSTPGQVHTYVSDVIPKHHTYDTYHPKCTECASDVKRGVHPNAPNK